MSNDHDIAHKWTNGGRISNPLFTLFLNKDVTLQQPHPKVHLTHKSEIKFFSSRLTPLTPVCISSSEVILSNIDVGISGIWECMVTSSRGNASQRIEIVVLETSATYCPADRVTNNKGDFRSVTNQIDQSTYLPTYPPTLSPLILTWTLPPLQQEPGFCSCQSFGVMDCKMSPFCWGWN